MKKQLITVAALTLLLSGCSSDKLFGNVKPDFDRPYTTTAKIRYGDLSAECDITRSCADNWTFSFSGPEYLMGLELSLADDEVTARLGELSVTAENNSAYQLIPEIIAQSVDTLNNVSADSITKDENGILNLNTQINGKNVIVTADENGSLITLKCPYHKLSVEFGKQMTLALPDEIETLETEDISIIFEDE